MSSQPYSLEPFPLFVDSALPLPSLFSTMDLARLLSSSSHGARKQTQLIPTKLRRSLELKYYQYEVTFGLYVMTPAEKMAINVIVLGCILASACAVHIGLKPFLVRTICQIIYYLYGSWDGVEDICEGACCV